LELVVHAFNEKLVEIPFENTPALNGVNKVKATH